MHEPSGESKRSAFIAIAPVTVYELPKKAAALLGYHSPEVNMSAPLATPEACEPKPWTVFLNIWHVVRIRA